MIKDTALIFEGGGTRASYTAGALVTMLEEGIEYLDIYGISAGSSHTVNYVSKDIGRSKASFVEFMALPGVAGWGGFLRGRGYFNAEYIYEKACLGGERLPFNFEAFMENPARPHIEAYECDTGRTVYWGKDDMTTLSDLMRRVRAGSTMPFFMNPIEIDGKVCIDGGLGDSWGIPLAQAKRDGYKKFFIVLTQTHGYRKAPERRPWLTKALFGRRKNVVERMLKRYGRYNAILDEIKALEKSGQAYVFYPRTMPVNSRTTDQALLRESYRRGYEQAREELRLWRGFL